MLLWLASEGWHTFFPELITQSRLMEANFAKVGKSDYRYKVPHILDATHGLEKRWKTMHQKIRITDQ